MNGSSTTQLHLSTALLADYFWSFNLGVNIQETFGWLQISKQHEVWPTVHSRLWHYFFIFYFVILLFYLLQIKQLKEEMQKEIACIEASRMKGVSMRPSWTHAQIQHRLDMSPICLRMFGGLEPLTSGRSFHYPRHQCSKVKTEDKVHTQCPSHIDFSHESVVKIQPVPTVKCIH